MRFPFSLKWSVKDGKSDLDNRIPDKPAGRRVFETRTKNIDGFPLQRIVGGFKGPADVVVSAFLFVSETDDRPVGWFEVGRHHVRTGTLFYFDVPTLLDSPGAGQQGSAGTTCVMFVVVPAISLDDWADGDYVLVAGSDASNPAF
jgi:hypothetical protein